MNYLRGIPEDFDRNFAGYNFSLSSNLTFEGLRSRVVGYVPSGHSYPGLDVPMTSDFYCFFHRTDTSCDVVLAHRPDLHVALEPDKYGFDGVDVDVNPQRVDIELSSRQCVRYEKLLSAKRAILNELLATIGDVVNLSMVYDFERVIQLGREKGLCTKKYERLSRFFTNFNGSLKGICTDSGKLIRQLLCSIGMEERILFTSVKTLEVGYNHDTTLVFDSQTGRWAVVNSKSPTKLYSLTPKSRINTRKNGYSLIDNIIVPVNGTRFYELEEVF